MYNKEQLASMHYVIPGEDRLSKGRRLPALKYNKNDRDDIENLPSAQELRDKYYSGELTVEEKMEVIDKIGLGTLHYLENTPKYRKKRLKAKKKGSK